MKKHLWKIYAVISIVLLLVGVGVICYVQSPYNPRNVSDADVVRKGTEYAVKISGISDYDDTGFSLVFNGLYLNDGEVFIKVSEDGFLQSVEADEGDIRLDGKYCSPYIGYESYDFCGGSYKNQVELETFFESPDRIYNFDVNNLSGYIQDIIAYKKQFYGEATVKIYRNRFVITEVFIGEEKVLTHKDIS